MTGQGHERRQEQKEQRLRVEEKRTTASFCDLGLHFLSLLPRSLQDLFPFPLAISLGER